MVDYTRSQFEIELASYQEHLRDGDAERREACEDEVKDTHLDLGINALPIDLRIYIENLENSLDDANNLTQTGKRYKTCHCCGGMHDTTDGRVYSSMEFCQNCADYTISPILRTYNQEWE